jgi:hypothetical protein
MTCGPRSTTSPTTKSFASTIDGVRCGWPPNHQHPVLNNEREPEGQLNDHEQMLIRNRPDQETINKGPHQRHDRQGDDQRNIRIESECRIERQAHVHAKQNKVAVREVHHAADAVDEPHAQGDKPVCASDQQPFDQRLKQFVHKAAPNQRPR